MRYYLSVFLCSLSASLLRLILFPSIIGGIVDAFRVSQRQPNYRYISRQSDWTYSTSPRRPLLTLFNDNDTIEEQDSGANKESILRTKANELFQQAQSIRRQLPNQNTSNIDNVESAVTTSRVTKWNVPNMQLSHNSTSTGYRLYVNIGREDGTWMDPRWGASQRRLEFTIDIQFIDDTVTDQNLLKRMIQDNLSGSTSSLFKLKIAPFARLRSGFEEMKCSEDGIYRIDDANTIINNGRVLTRTVRFFIPTDGTTDDSSYGDINVPRGDLFFSIPSFGTNGVRNLSTKDGIVSIRQIGWNTGWRRMESRIVGTFRALPINDAQRRDGF